MDRREEAELERRIRARAHLLWIQEGRPEGRAEDHWEMAKELIAIEDHQREATKPNPAATSDIALAEPVEPLLAVENQGEFPTLTDQGEEQASPSRPARAGD